MKKIFVSTAIVLLLLSVLAGATFAAPALAGKQELPFKGTLQSVEAYVINFPIMSVTASGSGNATQLGRFTVNYEVEVNLLTLAGIGSAQFISTNGDSLYAEGLGQAAETGTPGVVNVVEVYTITGGTGRFAGASGNITWKRVVDTNTGVTSGTLSGNIVLR